ncbi:MAG TPA: T9SS type A sorting domain-containing protein [Saprospiraceae bacterium]|nr:T9SS type A sorting domain-containing protein [Saprospiraceae bacterium]
MQVFPNPSTTSIRVQSAVLEQTPVRWEIRDVLGRVALSQSQKEIINGQPINIEKLDAGLYAITIYTDGKRQTLRFVKQ